MYTFNKAFLIYFRKIIIMINERTVIFVQTEFAKAARDMLIKIKDEMYCDNTGLFRERAGDDFPAYLWPFSVTIEAVSAYVSEFPDDREIVDFYRFMIDEILPKYRDKNRNDYRVYNSTTDGGDPFYDDDAWIALEFIRAAEFFSDKKYLQRAIETAEYCFSGEDNLLGGGIYWKEKDCRTKHTCINGPASLLACELYSATKDKKYLEKAISLYQFTKKYLLDECGVYNDNINADTGKVDFAKYTYNSGTMTDAGIMLGKLTGESLYTDDAVKCADSSLSYFAEDDLHIRCDNPWFCSWLLCGYIKVAELGVSQNDRARFESFKNSLEVCINNPISGGFWNKKWTKPDGKNDIPQLIDQAGTVKCLVLTCKFESMIN